MTLEKRVEQLESRLNNLQNAFLQSQKNQVPVTAKTDDTANKVVDITPWTATKTAYINDTEITFYDVPQGNVTVFIDGYSGNYEVVRIQNRLTVKFEPMKKATDVTINII